jgi:hypothetical protein
MLVRSLPPEGSAMSAARREQWIEMARAALAFIYTDGADTTAESAPSEEE